MNDKDIISQILPCLSRNFSEPIQITIRRERTEDNFDLKMRTIPSSKPESFQVNRASQNQYDILDDQPKNKKNLVKSVNLEDENAYEII